MATDTTDKYWQLDKEYYTIVPDHDFIVRVIEHQPIDTPKGDGSGEMVRLEISP